MSSVEKSKRPVQKIQKITPLEYLLRVVNDEEMAPEFRMRAASAAAPYCHPRLDKAVQSKKDEAVQDAKDAAVGKFATPTAPKLSLN